jgi:hypothetical protein
MMTMNDLISIGQELLEECTHPDPLHRNADLILRAERILGPAQDFEDVWRPRTISTEAIPRLIRAGWRVFYEVKISDTGGVSPMVFGMVRAPIGAVHNSARKDILIPRENF